MDSVPVPVWGVVRVAASEVEEALVEVAVAV